VSTHDSRLAALEKYVTVMKQDIIYKLDDTNTVVTMVKGVTGSIAQDVKLMRSQIRTMDSQIKTMDLRLEGIDARLARLEEQQTEQGQDIKDIKRRLDGFDQRFDDLNKKFDQVLHMLSKPTSDPQQEK
jgi:archaellum component FlaC